MNRDTIRKQKYDTYNSVSSRGKTYMNGQTNKDNAIAYCHHENHIGYLNENLMKKHKCLEKQCRYLEKYEDKHYWIQRSIKQVLKKMKKNNNKGVIYIDSKGFGCADTNIDYLSNYAEKKIKETGEIPEIRYKETTEKVFFLN